MNKQSTEKISVYLEVGKKKTFAGAFDWPGWSRGGKDELSALQALMDYGERYKPVAQIAGYEFNPPDDISIFSIEEQLDGNTTTDFGAPGAVPLKDKEPLEEVELERIQTLLKACWSVFNQAVKAATGMELRKGPRGGGRELEKIVQHVVEANKGYLSSIGGKYMKNEAELPLDELNSLQSIMLDFLGQSARGELPAQGPRGGVYWPPRYFTRRVAWHMLDHTWEIEDRAA